MPAFPRQIPAPQLVLGLAGLIPFWLPVLLLLAEPELPVGFIITAQKLYAAVILSFLGGVHWGMTVTDRHLSTWTRVGWSVTPSLIGWTGALLSGAAALIVLAAGFGLAAAVDLNSLPEAASWYRRLRLLLSVGAIAALLAGLLAITVVHPLA